LSVKITDVSGIDIRFPTSRDHIGSDSVHVDPDYSAAYAILRTNEPGVEGHGLTFTIGRGTEVCVAAIEALKPFVAGRSLDSICADMRGFWRSLTQESQLRWIGPEKGVIHLATAAIVNAVWDLWAKAEKKPVWKLLIDLTPEQLVSCIDFQYISDVLTPEEAIAMLQEKASTKGAREQEMLRDGFPAYNTSIGWLGYSDEQVREYCREAIGNGWTHFKMKVGASNIEDDLKRASLIRGEIGSGRKLMMDANQRWSVNEAIANIRRLAQYDPWWFEEPTCPDDVLGYATIARAVAPVKLAGGEQCQNRVLFKQFLQSGAIGFCQIDSCRLGGVNEVLSVILMAAKFGVPVCPHAGGVGLCEYVQHLALFDYIAVSGSLENRLIEYVDHLHEHFLTPVRMQGGRYLPPAEPGYSIEMKPDSRERYSFPGGAVWAAA